MNAMTIIKASQATIAFGGVDVLKGSDFELCAGEYPGSIAGTS